MATESENTFFAPPQRDTLEIVGDASRLVSGGQIAQDILDAIPDLAMILNDKRQIVAANQQCLSALNLLSKEQLLGKRPGEAVNCIHVGQGPNGCGTSVACRECGAAKAILNCLKTHDSAQYECRITSRTSDVDSSLDFLAKASYVRIGEYPLVLLVLRDTSAEKRKEALERLFFHDVLNTVGGMIGLADLMITVSADQSTEYAHLIHHLAENVAEEITAHRNLMMAEKGTLQIDPVNVNVSDMLHEIAEGLAYHPISKGLIIEAEVDPDCNLVTDKVLVRRIVSNLTKNALEASKRGSVIRLSAATTRIGVSIKVSNPGEIPQHVQSQLFKRSFSTKGSAGRGLGTYSIKLFAERYLHGNVGFVSSPEGGTEFTVDLPSLGQTTAEI